jgi:uncharacterized protein (UPF0332 family)
LTRVDEELARASEALEPGRYVLQGGYHRAAAREAYMPVFPATMALLVSRTGKEPRIHRGVQVELANPGRTESWVGIEVASTLGRFYPYKAFLAYGEGTDISPEAAAAAIATAVSFVAHVQVRLFPPSSPP